MNPKLKKVLIFSGAYLAVGVANAAYTSWLYLNDKPHFNGIGDASPTLGLIESVVAWPYALIVNFTAK